MADDFFYSKNTILTFTMSLADIPIELLPNLYSDHLTLFVLSRTIKKWFYHFKKFSNRYINYLYMALEQGKWNILEYFDCNKNTDYCLKIIMNIKSTRANCSLEQDRMNRVILNGLLTHNYPFDSLCIETAKDTYAYELLKSSGQLPLYYFDNHTDYYSKEYHNKSEARKKRFGTYIYLK